VVGKAGMNYTLPNGKQVPYSILYKGTTYLPMRKVAELVGKEVTWDQDTNTAGINDIAEHEKSAASGNDGNVEGTEGTEGSTAPVDDGDIKDVEESEGSTVPESTGNTEESNNTEGSNTAANPKDSEFSQKPIRIVEIVPTIGQGEALLKINFNLPEGSVITNGNQTFTIMCDSVNSAGISKVQSKNIYMLEGANSYTAYIPVDASGGSATCKIYYKAYAASGYLSGILTDKGTEKATEEISLTNGLLKEIEVKEGSTTEITLDAVKGVLFTATLKLSSPTLPTSEFNLMGIRFYEKSNDGSVKASPIMYIGFAENKSEEKISYTFDPDKEYALAVYAGWSNYYCAYYNINISDNAIKTGQLAYGQIQIDDTTQIGNLPDDQEKLLKEKIDDIIARIIKPGMSDIDKEYAIFKYVKSNTVYGFGQNCNNAYGCLIENVAVCEGYAEATKRLLDAAGIENYIAYGVKGDGMYEGPHAWNIVKIGDEYFHLDALQNRFNLNDADARNNYYSWEEGSIPACSSSFSISQGLSFFVHGGYVYYISDNSFTFNINRCKPDGSEDIRLITSRSEGTFITHDDEWIYFFKYEGSKIYKAGLDGSGETLFCNLGDGIRIHDGDISGNALYLLAQTGTNGNYKMNIIKVDLVNANIETTAEFNNDVVGLWEVGDYFYYYRRENGEAHFFRMSLDGSNETMVY